MNFGVSRDLDDAKRAVRCHEADCEDCRELGKNGDMCPEGTRLLNVARDLYKAVNDPPDREEDD